jgi:hypothetical protein
MQSFEDRTILAQARNSIFSNSLDATHSHTVAIRSTIHKFEDVVENVETSISVRQELEGLSVVHRSLFFIDLKDIMISTSEALKFTSPQRIFDNKGGDHTKSAPVTSIKTPPLGLDGWASRVAS